MTNPDNVGGLPELPEPTGWVCIDNYRARIEFTNVQHVADEWMQDKRLIVSAVNTAGQMRAYGEKCRDDDVAMIATYERNKAELRRAAPADNVGGLRAQLIEQADHLDAKLGQTGALSASLRDAADEIARLRRELCRAAPAGGDVERDADFYSAGYSNGYKHATKDSAPAGSGEVDLSAVSGRACDFSWDCEVVPVSVAAALIRKLSQGADYVMVPRVPTEAMEVAFCETWFAKRRPIDDPEMADAYAAMIAASQGQEGGHARD